MNNRKISDKSSYAIQLSKLVNLIESEDLCMININSTMMLDADRKRTGINQDKIQISDLKIKSLQKRGLINVKKIPGYIQISLTDMGLNEYLRIKAKKANDLADDDICIVVFDIPETKRKKRNQIRELLKNVGCIKLQKSVWATKKNIGRSLIKLLQSNNTHTPLVRIFNAREIT